MEWFVVLFELKGWFLEPTEIFGEGKMYHVPPSCLKDHVLGLRASARASLQLCALGPEQIRR